MSTVMDGRIDNSPELVDDSAIPRQRVSADPPVAGSRTAWWGNRSITTKLITAIGVPTLAALLVGAVGLLAMQSATTSANELYDQNLTGIETLGHVEGAFTNMQLASLSAGAARTKADVTKELDRFDRASVSFDEAMTSYLALDLSDEQRAIVDTISSLVEDYRVVQAEILTPLSLSNNGAGWIMARDHDAAPLISDADDAFAELGSIETSRAEEAVAHVNSSASTQTVMTMTIVLAALALSTVIGLGISRGITSAVRKIRHVIKGVAAGDLTGRTGITTRDELGEMGAALDEALTDLSTVLTSVAEGVDTVASTSEELSATTVEISTAAQQTSMQAESVTTTSAQVSANIGTMSTAAEQMSASIQEIASSAANAAAVANRGVDAARSTTDVMTRLNESSGEIGAVISLITSIADQTNLLALNATIEAARAGDAGKGFAVVAGEVKELAQESGRAAGEIGRLVDGIQQNAAAAVSAIDDISHIIADISDQQATIASAVEEQTATTHEISRNVSEAAGGAAHIDRDITLVSSAADSTTEALSQSSRAVAELSTMAAGLRSAVSRFTF